MRRRATPGGSPKAWRRSPERVPTTLDAARRRSRVASRVARHLPDGDHHLRPRPSGVPRGGGPQGRARVGSSICARAADCASTCARRSRRCSTSSTRTKATCRHDHGRNRTGWSTSATSASSAASSVHMCRPTNGTSTSRASCCGPTLVRSAGAGSLPSGRPTIGPRPAPI